MEKLSVNSWLNTSLKQKQACKFDDGVRANFDKVYAVLCK
jgi:hypothetical protein